MTSANLAAEAEEIQVLGFVLGAKLHLKTSIFDASSLDESDGATF